MTLVQLLVAKDAAAAEQYLQHECEANAHSTFIGVPHMMVHCWRLCFCCLHAFVQGLHLQYSICQ